MVSITFTGDITKNEYDQVVDIERIEFTDKTAKTDCYVEVPRLEGKISFQNKKSMSVLITDEEGADKKVKDPVMVLNSVLYMVRKSDDTKPRDIIQFSSGGMVLRLIADKQTTFRMRGNRNFKVVLK